jgi:hypothetical protein
MRKVKSTALLGAFVAVASVGFISHEAHGATITSVITNISKEMLPGSVTLSAPVVTPGVNYPSNSQVQITLTLNGATFVSDSSYSIENNSTTCSTTGNGLSSITFANTAASTACSLSEGASYTITGGASGVSPSSVVFSVPQTSSSIVLSYSSNVNSSTGNDASSPVTLAQVMQQLSVSANSVTQAVISPSSLTAFTDNSPSATNAVVISNSAYNNSTWSNTISSSIAMSFVFSSIPSSVTLVSASDVGNTTKSISSATPGNNSATVTASFTVASDYPFKNGSSDTISFGFSNSGNIQPGTIVLSSITGVTSSTSYVYLSTPQNFINFTFGGTQLYIPDALAHSGSNVIQSGYITISMPTSASIASVTVLNNSSASCPVPSLIPEQNNGMNTGVYLIDLGALAGQCTGLTPGAWQTGVPLVIFISGSNATPNNITADAYATFFGHLKRIPVDVVNSSSTYPQFSY